MIAWVYKIINKIAVACSKEKPFLKMSIKSNFTAVSLESFGKNRVDLSNSHSPIFSSRKQRKRWLLLEAAGVTMVLVVIVALISLPVVFFYLPRVCYS